VAKRRPIAGARVRIAVAAPHLHDENQITLAIAQQLHNRNGITAHDRSRQPNLRPTAGADLLRAASVGSKDEDFGTGDELRHIHHGVTRQR